MRGFSNELARAFGFFTPLLGCHLVSMRSIACAGRWAPGPSLSRREGASANIEQTNQFYRRRSALIAASRAPGVSTFHHRTDVRKGDRQLPLCHEQRILAAPMGDRCTGCRSPPLRHFTPDRWQLR
jgi:hypothetical protein